MPNVKFHANRELFKETTHSPALADIVGAEVAPRIVDFCFIANPYYPTPEMMSKLIQKIPEIIKTYPSSIPSLARRQLAEVLHVKPEYLLLGNGATELITLIENELIDEIAIPIPTFSEYLEKLPHKNASCIYQLVAENDYQLDLNRFADWIEKNKISSALIINPGNPTGQFIPLDELKLFLQRMSYLDVILLDESFIDFSGIQNASLMPEIESFQNVIVIRSMSKHCGVPGLRLGYCCTANAKFMAQMQALLPVWNINTISEYFLSMLPDTDPEYQLSVQQIVRDVHHFQEGLKEIPGVKVYPTGSNFILIRINFGPDAHTTQLRLLEEYGLYVRDCSNKVGLDKYHIRVASQGPVNDDKLISALKELSAEYPS